jgi:hypothetical protein
MRPTILLLLLLASLQATAQNDSGHCASVLMKEKPLDTPYLSSIERSEVEFCRVSDTLDGVQRRLRLRNQHFDFWHSFREEVVPMWFDLVDVFCEFHPSAPFLDPFGNVERCPGNVYPLHTSKDVLDKLFSQNMVMALNFQTFVSAQNEEDRINQRK